MAMPQPATSPRTQPRLLRLFAPIAQIVLVSVWATAPLLSAQTASTPPSIAEAIASLSANLVFVSDPATGGAGSGFICNYKGKPSLFSNIHVVADMKTPRFTLLNQALIKPGGVGACAVGHDILYLSLPDSTTPPKLDAAENVEQIARVGDQVFVLGNSEGARVITPLTGQIVGIGPELVEVTAEFVPGNSGSPIIHARSGKVIAIATYLTTRDRKFLSGDSDAPRIRRFGYRLDSVKTWQPMDWTAFQRDRDELKRIQLLSADLISLVREMSKGPLKKSPRNPAFASQVNTFAEKMANADRMNPADRLDAYNTFLRAMRSVCLQDVTNAGQRMRYDYFIKTLGEERAVRTQLAELFDTAAKKMR